MIIHGNPMSEGEVRRHHRAIIRLVLARNALDAPALVKLLSDDVIYDSQHSLTPITGKPEVSRYLEQRFAYFRTGDGSRYRGRFVPGAINLPEAARHPCAIVYGEANLAVEVWVLKLDEADKIRRIDILTTVPDPRTAVPYGL
jgi:hypothetical protein